MQYMPGKLSGKVALITGGSSGIGLASAKRLASEGADVIITGRRQSELDKAVAEIDSNVTAIRGDVSVLADLDRIYEVIGGEKGALDIVVANAGFVEFATLADATPEHFDKTFGINARGTFFTVKKALPLLRDRASIVLVASCVQYMGIPHYTAYAATKAAIRSFARSWAAELKHRSIRVNTLSPGPIDTPILDLQVKTKDEADALRDEFSRMVPLGRIGRADEMASAVLFLASDESSYCTGIDLAADGGIAQF